MNKELTMQYYEGYNSCCNCGDCRYFIKHIEQEQPDICEYLKKLGINPLKPYELMSIYNEKEKRIEYFDCAYLVIGSIDKEVEQEINGIKVTSCSKDKYPTENISDDYFFISFGPISMNYTYAYNRHYTYEEKVNIIKKAIDEVDPMGLLILGCPKDEYLQEARLIANNITIKKANSINVKMIQDIFKSQFNESISLRVCKDIARRMNTYLNMIDFFKNLEDNVLLKGKISVQNLEITLKVHEDFIVKSVGGNTYINDKFYYDIEDQDLLDSLCNFVEDNDTIYVQYNHKHFGFHYEHVFRYFEEIERKKYSYWKLKHRKDIEFIFDNKGVIYSSNFEKLSKDEIIELMYNEPVKEEYVKLFYSPDKMKRIIISKNSVGSYSYSIERLTILNSEGIKFYGKYAFWEPKYGHGGISFYENVESLLSDIRIEIKDWTEK